MPESPIDTGNLIKGIIGSVIRFLLAGTVGWLVQRGVVTNEQGEMIIPAIVLGVITLAWAIFRKYRVQERIAVALALPARSTPEQLDTAVQAKRAGEPTA